MGLRRGKVGYPRLLVLVVGRVVDQGGILFIGLLLVRLGRVGAVLSRILGVAQALVAVLGAG